MVLILCLFLLPFREVYADSNTMNQLDIRVVLDENGNATITEIRTMELNQGTENFMVMENLDGAQIHDFSVSENGQAFTNIGDWDIYASQENKTNKCGIVKTSRGYELCLGIGFYGSHTYTVSYKITDWYASFKTASH